MSNLLLIFVFIVVFFAWTGNAHQDTMFDHKNAAHIKEDIKEHFYVDVNDKTGEREMEFLNFQHYDYDNNLVLDGIEILMELNHNSDHVSEKLNKMNHAERQDYWNEKYHKDADMVDLVIKEYDTDNNGFISFSEYMALKSKLKN